MLKKLFALTLFATLLIGLSACNSSSDNDSIEVTIDNNAMLKWNTNLLTAIRNAKLGPPMNARAFGVIYTAAYDAWALYEATSLPVHASESLRRSASANSNSEESNSSATLVQTAEQQKAVSYAIYKAALDIYPSQKALFDQTMTELGYTPTLEADSATSPEATGLAAADAVLNFKHQDGSNQLGNLHSGAYSDYTGYAPVNTADTLIDHNRWQPLRVTNAAGETSIQKFLVPHWGNVATFGVSSGSALRPEAPFDVDSAEFQLEMQEVVDYNANLTEREKVIAEYWADGPATETPPGHWMLFANYIVERDDLSFERTLQLYFLLGNALSDASVVCWDAKRHYDFIRPISIIREKYRDQTIRGWGGPNQGTVELLGQNWQPYQATTFVTPPFSEYTSGHSTFSAAAAEILRLFTGSDKFGLEVTIPAGSFKIENNVPANDLQLKWNTFSDAANEAGISRLYGGIHFQSANVVGQRMGRATAQEYGITPKDYFNQQGL